MKKFFTLLLALVMIFAVAACGAGKTDTKTDGTGKTDAPPPSDNSGDDNASDNGGAPAADARVGYYDDDVDHFARDEYNFTYCFTGSSALTDSLMAAWARMESKYNFKVDEMCSDGDGEAYVQGIEVIANRGTDGLFVDCDPTIANRVYELLDELEIPYVCLFNLFTDSDGHAIAPCVMLDNYRSGQDSVTWYAERYKDYWGEIDGKTIGLLTLGWSTSPTLAERTFGAAETFKSFFPDGTVFDADGVTSGNLNTEGGYDLTSQFMSAHPEIEHWIIFACIEDYAQGAARYVETVPNPENVLITNSGSNLLPLEFASGYKGSWKVCYAVSDISYAGPAAMGLIALADGRATADTLWKELRQEGDICTKYVADPVMVTEDNYDTFKADMFKLYTLE